MSLVEEFIRINPQKDTVLSIGVFDGVHLGHKRLISGLNKNAINKGNLAGVLTFNRHPEEIVSPHNKLCYLTTLEQRQNLIKSLHPHFVIVLPFTKDVAGMTARQFINLLQKYLRMKGLVVGPNFTLGKSREGEITTLQRLGKEMGFTMEIIPPLIIDGVMASSTTIRKALHNGDIETASNLLGRHFNLEGKVISGVGQSTMMGFPTANLDISPQQCLPNNGVYATLTYIGSQKFFSLTNIGGISTLGRISSHAVMGAVDAQFVEVHLIDFISNLNGITIKVEFLERLREELHFNNIESLRFQINTDIEHAKVIFKKHTKAEFCQEIK